VLFTKLTIPESSNDKLLSDSNIYVYISGGDNASNLITGCIVITAILSSVLIALLTLYRKYKIRETKGKTSSSPTMVFLNKILAVFFSAYHELIGLMCQIYVAFVFYWV